MGLSFVKFSAAQVYGELEKTKVVLKAQGNALTKAPYLWLREPIPQTIRVGKAPTIGLINAPSWINKPPIKA